MVNFDSISVSQYVEMLKLRERKPNTIQTLHVEKKAKLDWIKKSDIPYLMKFIDSKEDANCVSQLVSSKLPLPNESTLGGQVMNLIDAYRLNENYPNFLTDCSKTDKARIREIRKWWNSVK